MGTGSHDYQPLLRNLQIAIKRPTKLGRRSQNFALFVPRCRPDVGHTSGQGQSQMANGRRNGERDVAGIRTGYESKLPLISTTDFLNVSQLSAFKMGSGCRPFAIDFQREAGDYFGPAVKLRSGGESGHDPLNPPAHVLVRGRWQMDSVHLIFFF